MSDTNGTPKPKGGFNRIIKDKGGRRLLVFVGVVAIGAVTYATFSSSGPAPEHSAVRTAPQLASTQGAKQITPEYEHALNKDTGDRIAEARHDTSKSVTPPLVLPSTVDRLPTSLPGGDDETPPAVPVGPRKPRVPVSSPEVPVQPIQRPVQIVQPAPRPVPVDMSLVQAMTREMQQINPGNPVAAKTEWFYSPDMTSGAQTAGGMQSKSVGGQSGSYHGMAQQSGASQQASSQSGPSTSQASKSRFIAPATGTIVYAHLLGRVNSDTPGPVIGEILQGPFANSRLIGSFQFSEQGVIMKFSTMTVPYKDENGEDQSEVVPINAVAVDSAHLGTAMATDIDRHLLERIGVAFGTAFLQGLGQAVAQSGSTVSAGLTGTVVSNSTLNTKDQLLVGAGSAAGAAGQVFTQVYGNRRTTITVEADTPMGLLFLGNSNGN